jgi:hypothetical protein
MFLTNKKNALLAKEILDEKSKNRLSARPAEQTKRKNRS